jgi:hypothetical protein
MNASDNVVVMVVVAVVVVVVSGAQGVDTHDLQKKIRGIMPMRRYRDITDGRVFLMSRGFCGDNASFRFFFHTWDYRCSYSERREG